MCAQLARQNALIALLYAYMHERRVCVPFGSRHNHRQVAFWHEHCLPRARSSRELLPRPLP
jgi:hypothetical protein